MAFCSVIVRAYGRKPLKRVAIMSQHNLIYITNPKSLELIDLEENSHIDFPAKDVFRFDGEIFEVLSKEWRANGTTSPEAWETLQNYSEA